MDTADHRTRARPRSLVVSGLILIGAALLAQPAQAHPFLVTSSPQPGERLASPPEAVTLRFVEAIVPGSARVQLRTADDRPVPTGRPHPRQGALEVQLPLPTLRGGVYVASWEARSATDGHLEVGEFAFAVGAGGALPAVSGSSQIAWPETLARWAGVAALLVAFGGLASEVLVWRHPSRPRGAAVARLPMGWVLGVALLGTVAEVLLIALRTPPGGPEGAAPLTAIATRPALLAAGQAFLVGWGLWLLPVRWARPWALAPVGLALIAVAVRGHAGSGAPWWATPANALHLLAVGLWLGALAHLLLVAWRWRAGELRSALVEGARRYASLALGLVAVALGSGAAVAAAQFASPGQLVGTTYGRLLLAKLALVLGALALALAARRRALGGNPGPRVALLRRLVGPEGALLLAAVLLAAVMANTSPPRAVAAETLLGPPPLRGPVVRLADLAGSPLAVHLAAAPGQLQVRIVDPTRDPVVDAEVEMAGRAPDGTVLGVAPRPCGPGCVTTGFRWAPGTTTLAVTVSSEEWGRGTARFAVPWPPGPSGEAILERMVEAMRGERRIAMVERVSSGLGGRAENRTTFGGRAFVSQALYAAGGATDVRIMPSPPGTRRLTLYLPGSAIWFELEADAATFRLKRETIVSPGHLIERTFRYG